MAINCQLFSAFAARRTPNFLKEFTKDWFPRDVIYSNTYRFRDWPSFHGTELTWDRIHVAMPNDAGDWVQMRADDCLSQICDSNPRQVDWGSTRQVFGKFARNYQTRALCMDQWRHIEEAKTQLRDIYDGLAKVPEYVIADWLKFQCAAGSNYLYICGAGLTTVAVTSSMFSAGLTTLNVGSDSNLPTSKLTMNYLERNTPPLQYNGYFRGDWVPAGTFNCITDMETVIELCNGNPALAGMYQAADFEKGGKFFKYGAMKGCGNFIFQIHPYPPRFIRTSTGTLTRVWPFPNMSATVGLSPVLDQQYITAPYQLSHVTHGEARVIFTGEIPSFNDMFKFGTRDLWGKWNWCNDPTINVYDPNSGVICLQDNHKRNKGYMWADFEAGIQNQYPERELMILHQRESTPVVDFPRAAGSATTVTLTAQNLLPYNPYCNPNPGEETFLGNAGITDFGGITPED